MKLIILALVVLSIPACSVRFDGKGGKEFNFDGIAAGAFAAQVVSAKSGVNVFR